MHAVVNRLPIKPGSDWGTLARKVDSLNASVSHPDFRGISLIRAGENEAVILVLFASHVALDEVSRNVAAPWFAEHMRPYLAGPADRKVGEIIAGALAAKNLN